jgi:DNA-binding response OmpR family regulator
MYGFDTRRYSFSVDREGGQTRPHLVLYDRDPATASLLVDVFNEEGFEVSMCATLEEIHAGLQQFPCAVVVTDVGWHITEPDLTADEHAAIVDLASRARLVLLSVRRWASQAADLALGDRVTVIPKPFDLEVVLSAVRVACAQCS